MHGLVNRALQRFAEDTQGAAFWAELMARALPDIDGFEAMLSYDDATTGRLIGAMAARLGVPTGMMLEDLGTYLVCHPNTEALRRLLRFGGVSFTEFLHSLEDLADRVRLAVTDLILPEIGVSELRGGRFRLVSEPGLPGFGHVLMGVLRAMADDYGVLARVDLLSDGPEGARITVAVADLAFAEGRRFDLAFHGGLP